MGEITQRTRTARDKSQENTTSHPFSGISPKTTLLLSLTSIDSRLCTARVSRLKQTPARYRKLGGMLPRQYRSKSEPW